ncbi:hypothetical protein Ddye_004448 [Dipteronia dyeriana]|uniref:Reverse transcriptase domain-containing protein n=1 Tax=Dipteronia dyeriana TaxID=168575 RepID=A0AAE0CWE2_9ROSI|nr:hypothetical protein Ddye_004448 [Dipteronia dyeriana]
MNFIHEFHKDGSVVKDLNCTFIALIPKVSKHQQIKDFRPISLVGSMYKVLAKVLAKRLKKVMDSVISPTQMAFVKGCQIVDSSVIVEEVIHSWKKDKVREGVVEDYGCWRESKWKWDVKLRRPSFNWEIEQWSHFLLVLESFTVRPMFPDALAWTFCPNGTFKFGSFRRFLEVQAVGKRCVDSKFVKLKSSNSWKPPANDSLLFNVDRAVKGNPGMASICGVLKKSDRRILCSFSSCVGIQIPISTELMAIHKA